MNHLKKIVLHGHLAEQFGDEHFLDVHSGAEAIRALIFTRPGFRSAIREGSYQVIRGDTLEGIRLDENTLVMGLGNAPLHIVPAISGAKNGGGAAKAIIGVALIAVAVASAGTAIAAEGATLGSVMGTTTAIGLSVGQVAGIGASLLLSGISQLISPAPKNPDAGGTPTQSYLFAGAQNTVTEGSAVPVVYGEMKVGSIVMGYSVINTDLSQAGSSSGKSGQGTVFQA